MTRRITFYADDEVANYLKRSGSISKTCNDHIKKCMTKQVISNHDIQEINRKLLLLESRINGLEDRMINSDDKPSKPIGKWLASTEGN